MRGPFEQGLKSSHLRRWILRFLPADGASLDKDDSRKGKASLADPTLPRQATDSSYFQSAWKPLDASLPHSPAPDISWEQAPLRSL